MAIARVINWSEWQDKLIINYESQFNYIRWCGETTRAKTRNEHLQNKPQEN
jgi:hypothetical protein